jgi:molybdenum cofactor cytidylyltransferase
MGKGATIACVVLAAGMAKRFGSTKQLAALGRSGKTLVQNAVDVANESRAAYVFLVLGHDASEIATGLKLGRAQIVLNKDYETGLSSSVKASIANIPSDCRGAIFMVADQPNLTREILNRLIESFEVDSRSGNEKKIYALSHGKEPRNPVLIASELFPKLQELSGDIGARDVVRRNSEDVKLVEVSDSAVFTDIDTPLRK